MARRRREWELADVIFMAGLIVALVFVFSLCAKVVDWFMGWL